MARSVAVLGFCVWGLTGWKFLFGGSQRGIMRQRREVSIAESKEPFRTRGSEGASSAEADAILKISCQNGIHFEILLISHF